jgi:tellurite resistance protein TerC
MGYPLWVWIAFNLFIVAMLALDIVVFHRHPHEIKTREALAWTGVWVTLALLFAAGVFHELGAEKGTEFLTGYILEESLSLDNMFAFVLIFAFMGTPAILQRTALLWGILSALVLRAGMILGGVALIRHFHWAIYLFGAFLVYTGIKMLFQGQAEVHPQKNPLIRVVSRAFPLTKEYEGQHFFVRRDRHLYATPLLLVLLLIESSDILFALDSIPAILAITTDPFIVYSSNVFAILGLRALYFVVARAISKFAGLKPAISAILCFVGAKMLIADVFKIPVHLSLAVVGTLVFLGIVLSLFRREKDAPPD